MFLFNNYQNPAVMVSQNMMLPLVEQIALFLDDHTWMYQLEKSVCVEEVLWRSAMWMTHSFPAVVTPECAHLVFNSLKFYLMAWKNQLGMVFLFIIPLRLFLQITQFSIPVTVMTQDALALVVTGHIKTAYQAVVCATCGNVTASWAERLVPSKKEVSKDAILWLILAE